MMGFFRTGLFFVLLICLAMTCVKQDVITNSCSSSSEEINTDTVSYSPWDRDDVPLPPTKLWRKVDIGELDQCQQRLWKYLEQMYPVDEPNYYDYHIYALKNEPDEHFERLSYYTEFASFFQDTVTIDYLYHDKLDCSFVDSTFFLEAIGPPTCRSYNAANVNYFYYYKLRYRTGPCPHIWSPESLYDKKCNTSHHNHCGGLSLSFKKATGELVHALGSW